MMMFPGQFEVLYSKLKKKENVLIHKIQLIQMLRLKTDLLLSPTETIIADDLVYLKHVKKPNYQEVLSWILYE